MDADYRIFKRKLYERMLNWKQTKDGKTALLIKGVRRVGKSTIAEEFAKREYNSYIVVDFANAPESVWEAVKNMGLHKNDVIPASCRASRRSSK